MYPFEKNLSILEASQMKQFVVSCDVANRLNRPFGGKIMEIRYARRGDVAIYNAPVTGAAMWLFIMRRSLAQLGFRGSGRYVCMRHSVKFSTCV